MEKKKVILDVDTGTDDAIAIMTAVMSENLEVLGVCAVNGNRGIDFTTENTLRVVEYLGKDIPVFRGCSLPMVVSLTEGRREDIPYKGPKDPQDNVHGDYIDLPPATIQEQPVSAVRWLVDTLMEAEDGEITLIPLGPLTNIAHAVRIEPRIIPKIKEIVYMGGGFRVGNKTALAEFNVWLDPEAAQAVLDCNIPFTFVTLDATHSAYVTMEDAARFRAIGTRPAEVVASLCEQRIAGYGEWQKVADVPAAPVHDPLTIAYLVDPTVITDIEDAPCVVDCGRGAAYGVTLFDIRNGRAEAKAPNCRVALKADREKYVDILCRLLENTKK